ncbi:MAG: cyclodeaminase/cyclohydrolase family protein [Oscillibacter sp.]
MNMTELRCTDFIAQLASAAPVPGGGSASALMGALGSALGNMVGSLTVGKKKYAAVEAEILQLKAQSDQLQEKFLSLAEADAAVFAPLANAYGLPRETEAQRREKALVMEAVLRDASAVPLEIMETCLEALRVVERFAQLGSRLALSDAGCAAACCRAALNAASLNVLINTKLMTDRAYAQGLNRQAETLCREGSAQADAIFAAVRAELI